MFSFSEVDFDFEYFLWGESNEKGVLFLMGVGRFLNNNLWSFFFPEQPVFMAKSQWLCSDKLGQVFYESNPDCFLMVMRWKSLVWSRLIPHPDLIGGPFHHCFHLECIPSNGDLPSVSRQQSPEPIRPCAILSLCRSSGICLDLLLSRETQKEWKQGFSLFQNSRNLGSSYVELGSWLSSVNLGYHMLGVKYGCYDSCSSHISWVQSWSTATFISVHECVFGDPVFFCWLICCPPMRHPRFKGTPPRLKNSW